MIKHSTGRHYYTVLYTSSNHSTSLVEVSDVASCCSQPLIIDLWAYGVLRWRRCGKPLGGTQLSDQALCSIPGWCFGLSSALLVTSLSLARMNFTQPPVPLGGNVVLGLQKHPKTMCPGVLRDPFSQILKFPIFMGTPNALDPETRVSCGECQRGKSVEVQHVFCIFLAERNGSKWRILRFLCSGPGDPTAARLRPRELRRAIRSCVNTWRSLRNRLVIQFHGIVMGFYCILLPYNLLRVVGKNQ